MNQRIQITKIVKRDGRVEEFNPKKITEAIRKAFIATKGGSGEPARHLSDEAVEILKSRFRRRIPTVENAQDIVDTHGQRCIQDYKSPI